MRIYIASSWKNKYLSEVINALRTVGHEVYDFRNLPSGDPGFHWTDVDKDCYAWTPEQYQSNLMHPLAERQFHNDKEAMEHCDACVLVLPSGRSAHTEAGWFAGREIPVFAYIPNKESFEPELMYKLFTGVCTSLEELTDKLNLCDYSYVLDVSNEIVDKMVEMCVNAFNERHVKSLVDVYGDTNSFDCGELPSILFSNTDKLTLLREGVAYYEDSLDSYRTENEIDKVIEECSQNLSSREADILNARWDLESLHQFDFNFEIEKGMRMYGDYTELSEIANIFANQGIEEALAYKYEQTSAKDTLPFYQNNYLHTHYPSFREALSDYMSFCSGIWDDWNTEYEMSAVGRFMDYWKMEKLSPKDIRGNYG